MIIRVITPTADVTHTLVVRVEDRKYQLVVVVNTKQRRFTRLCMLSGSTMNNQEEIETTM